MFEIISGRIAISGGTPRTDDRNSSPAGSRESRTITALVCIIFLLISFHVLVDPFVTYIHYALRSQLLYCVNNHLEVDKLFMICHCCLMQFEPILNDADGKIHLPKYIDPALKNDYPLDAVWKVGTFQFSLKSSNSMG